MNTEKLLQDYRRKQKDILNKYPTTWEYFKIVNEERFRKEFEESTKENRKQMDALEQALWDKLYNNSKIKELPNGRAVFEKIVGRARWYSANNLETWVEEYKKLEKMVLEIFDLVEK